MVGIGVEGGGASIHSGADSAAGGEGMGIAVGALWVRGLGSEGNKEEVDVAISGGRSRSLPLINLSS